MNKKLIIFDLDGTLTESKAVLTVDMAKALTNLLKHKKVAIISGCSWEQFEEQLIRPLVDAYPDGIINNHDFSKLFLLPTSGSQLYYYDLSHLKFHRIYHNDLTLKEKVEIYNAWVSSTLPKDFRCDPYGDIAEDRGSQVTFSMCGQKAPLSVKKSYDPNASIRSGIIAAMKTYLPYGFEIKIGGTTSIDVTRAGVDKAYGINKLLVWTGMEPENALFIGDALLGGDSESMVKELNVDNIEVSCPKETLDLINDINNGDL